MAVVAGGPAHRPGQKARFPETSTTPQLGWARTPVLCLLGNRSMSGRGCTVALSLREEEGRRQLGPGRPGPVGGPPAEAGVVQPAPEVRGGGVHQCRGAPLSAACAQRAPRHGLRERQCGGGALSWAHEGVAMISCSLEVISESRALSLEVPQVTVAACGGVCVGVGFDGTFSEV